MGRSPCQDDPPLACLRIDLVGLDGDLVVGVRDTGAQVLVRNGIPRAHDDGPLVDLVHDRQRRGPTPPPVSSSRHSASPNRASTRRASAPASGEPGPEPREELRSASSSGMAPTLAPLPGGGTRARRATVTG